MGLYNQTTGSQSPDESSCNARSRILRSSSSRSSSSFCLRYFSRSQSSSSSSSSNHSGLYVNCNGCQYPAEECEEDGQTHEISAAHSTVLACRVLLFLGLPDSLFLGLLLVHPRRLPLGETLGGHRCEIRSKFVALCSRVSTTSYVAEIESVTHFDLKEFLQTDNFRLLCLFGGLALRFKHKSWWKRVPILAFLAVRALPEPTESTCTREVKARTIEIKTYFSLSIASMKNLQTI